MITDESSYYSRFSDEIDDRFDFAHYHPELDELNCLDFITQFSVIKLGDNIEKKPIILHITSGATPKDIKYSDSGVMFLGARNVREGKLDLTEVTYIDISYHNGPLCGSKLKENDVLITMAGVYIGRCCVFDKKEKANVNQAVAKVEINTDIVIPKYLSMYLNSKYGQKGFLKYRHDVGQPNINLGEIQRIKVIIPSKDIQQEILNKIKPIETRALDFELNAEQSLEKPDKILLDALEIELPEETMSYFFKQGKQDSSDYYYRLNDEMGDRFHYLFNHPKLEILDKFKKKYQTVLLKDICREPIKRGEQPRYSDFGVRVIKTVDLKNRFIDYENTLRVTEDFYESKPQAHIQKNDILVTSTGYGSAGKIDIFNIDEAALADPQLLILRLNEEYDINFITYYLRSCFGQVQFDRWFSGSSGQIHLYPEDIGNFMIPSKESISLEKQKEIADKITEEYKKAWNYEQQARSKWKEAKELFERLILEDVQKV